MHSWTASIQEGIAHYLIQHAHWHCLRIEPIPEIVHFIHDQHFDGAITWLEPHAVSDVQKLGIPIVDVAGWIPHLPFPQVLLDDEAIGRLAATHLMELGLKEFAVVDRMYDPLYSVLRRDGFLSALREQGHDATVIRPLTAVSQSANENPADASPLRAWLRRLPKPVGFFAIDDNLALDVLEDCRRLQIRVPDEVAVLGVGNNKLAATFARPSLTSIAVPEFQIGLEAARLLESLIEGAPSSTDPIRLPPLGVVTRQSTDMLAIEDPDIRSAVQYIRQHVQNVTVTRLLRQIPMNRRYLERRFAELLGRSPHQEIRHQRIARAKMLLSQTDLSMADIARRSGFANSKRLANVFHAMTGQTPSAYRKNFRSYAE